MVKSEVEGQLSFEDILDQFKNLGEDASIGELEGAIKKFDTMTRRIQQAKREAEKKANEIKRRQEEEESIRIQKEAEEKARAHVVEVTSMDLPLNWNNIFLADERSQGVHIESIPDALVLSLSTLGKVDIEYISSITGEDYKTVICTLKGSIYQNPDIWGECFFAGWETADEYLSGNLKKKLESAKAANIEYDGYFEDNIKAIEKVLPPPVAIDDIYVTLGSPWVPASVIDEFITYLFGEPRYFFAPDSKNYYRNTDAIYATRHDEATGTWEIPEKMRFQHNIATTQIYGSERVEALHILEKTLNMKTIMVTDGVAGSKAGRVINQVETALALEKQQEMIKKFKEWVWSDRTRAEWLRRIYEDKYCCIRKRNYNGSFLTFPGLSPKIQLYSYQKDAVARIIFSSNTLLAHDVGAGKTYVMIAAGQELRRMRLSKKNMYVVPNNIVGQWQDIFLSMYSDAKLLCVVPKSFTPNKREVILKQIRDEEYDGIIIAYSCFEQIPLSKEYYIEKLKKEKENIEEIVAQKMKATMKVKNKQKSINKALSELMDVFDEEVDRIYFDDLGITRIFVDEAHNFKNVPIETQANNVLGISGKGSKRCQDMMEKIHMVQKKNDGIGAVFATGTPIINSITDAYVMQLYLQSGELAMLDLQSFDGWIGMFAEHLTQFEIDVDTSSYRLATRFAKFHNLTELATLLASVADFHQLDESIGLPKLDGYTDVLIAKTLKFEEYLKSISKRAELVRHRLVNRREDNMLKITTDGRKAALDMRLVDSSAPKTMQSKVTRCAENIADIYMKTSNEKGTQLVFCDISTPKAGFNIYDELKDELITLGIPKKQIAFAHDADTEKKRGALFMQIRNGEIRILLGSTFKLGVGVNIQDRLVALHHLDVPWRPADMTQREGRILRQGNMNSEIKIFRYITEGSFDAYSWQLLETKQRFISDLLSGSLADRAGTDIEGTVLDYAEVKALAVGNPLVKERVEAANKLAKYQALQRKLVETRMHMEAELMELPGKIAHQKDLIEKCCMDRLYYEKYIGDYREPISIKEKQELANKRKELRKSIYKAVRGNILETHERLLMNYRGFNVVLPANMKLEKLYVWLVREGKYYVELGDTELGVLTRIENFLERLDKHLDELEEGLHKLEIKEVDIKNEIAKNEDFVDEIRDYKKKIEEIDKQLGVDKK